MARPDSIRDWRVPSGYGYVTGFWAADASLDTDMMAQPGLCYSHDWIRVRLIDDRGRLFGLVNPIDLLVLAMVVVAVLVAANVLFGIFEGDRSDLVDVKFEVVALGVREFEPGQVSAGDQLYSSVAGRLGEIVAVEVVPSQIEVLGPDGEAVVVDSGLAVDIRMTVVGRGSADGLGYLVGGVRIQKNSRIDVVTAGLEAQRAYVSSVREAGSR